MLGEGVGVKVGEILGEGVGDAVTVGVGVKVGEILGEGVGDSVTVGVGVGDSVTEGVGLGDSVGNGVGVAVGSVPVGVGVASVLVGVGSGVSVGNIVAVGVGAGGMVNTKSVFQSSLVLVGMKLSTTSNKVHSSPSFLPQTCQLTGSASEESDEVAHL